MNPFKRSVLANNLLLKGFLLGSLGAFTYSSLTKLNKLKISGGENLKKLPPRGVLFVSNHQTYFADVISLFHVFFSCRIGFCNEIKSPLYLFKPKLNVYFVAAEETMKEGLVAKLFALAGAITIKRTWREKGQSISREVDTGDTNKVKDAINDGWVITFPQGTTKAFAPGRKGTAYIIKETQPIVVPIVINGFRRAFNKKGLRFKKKGTDLSITIKEPLHIDYNQPVEVILAQVMDAIEQSAHFLKVAPLENLD